MTEKLSGLLITFPHCDGKIPSHIHDISLLAENSK